MQALNMQPAIDAIMKLGQYNQHEIRPLDEDNIEVPTGLTNSELNAFIANEQLLHLYYNASRGASYFGKVKDDTKDALIESGMFANASNVQPGEGASLLYEGDQYALELELKRPSTRLDTKILLSELAKSGISEEVLNKAVKLAMVESAPAKMIKVVLR